MKERKKKNIIHKVFTTLALLVSLSYLTYKIVNIDSILNKTDVYDQIEVLKSITKEDIKEFLNKLTTDNQVSSKIISK